MNFKKKAALAGIILLGAIVALPATRDELEWYWRASHDRPQDYSLYILHWPKGRHVVEAKQRYQLRIWNETKRAQIREAMTKDAVEGSDREARHARLEHFFWKQVTNENSVFTYKDYLARYPNGEHAQLARRRMAELARERSVKSSGPNSTNN